MRVIQTYTFKMSPKTPYSHYPAIAHRFLDEQKLVSHRFLYFFDELIYGKSYEEALATGSCAKAVKDCPALGEIRFFDGHPYGALPLFFLSNIDTETELLIQDSLEKMMNIGTMLIVAHRLSTIQHADNIIVLSHGKIIEQGNHAELLEKKGVYYGLYQNQFAGFAT